MDALGGVPDDVRRELRAGEEIRWIGHPRPIGFAILEGAKPFLSAVAFAAICAYCQRQNISKGADGDWLQLGLPMLFALFIAATPLFEYVRARRTTYVISDRRLIILNGLVRPSKRSFAPADIGPLTVRAKSDDSGTIIFLVEREKDPEGGWIDKKIGFKAIARVHEVERQIMRLKEEGAKAAPPG